MTFNYEDWLNRKEDLGGQMKLVREKYLQLLKQSRELDNEKQQKHSPEPTRETKPDVLPLFSKTELVALLKSYCLSEIHHIEQTPIKSSSQHLEYRITLKNAKITTLRRVIKKLDSMNE